MRTRAERRHNDWTKAKRKWRIDLDTTVEFNRKTDDEHLYNDRYWMLYDNLHQYSKNKIHCSCPMCSAKTNNKHRSGARGWAPSYNPSMHDRRTDDHVNALLNEYESVVDKDD